MKRTNEFGVSGEQVEGIKEENSEIAPDQAAPSGGGEPEPIKSAEEKKDD